LFGDYDEPTAAQTRAEIGNFVAPSANEPHFTANRANPVKCDGLLFSTQDESILLRLR